MKSITPWLLGLYIIALPLSMAAMELFSWSLFLIATGKLIYKYKKNKKWPDIKTGLEWPFLGLILITIISNIYHQFPAAEQFTILGEFRWILLFYSFVYILQGYIDKTDKFIWIYASVIMLLGLYCIFQAFTGFDLMRSPTVKDPANFQFGIMRVRGFLKDTMTFSYILGMNFFFFLATYLFSTYKTGAQKKINLICLLLLAVNLCLSLTRGAWISVAITIIFVFLLFNKRALFKKAIPFLTCIAISLSLMPLTKERVATLSNPQFQSNLQRTQIWSMNFLMFLDHPLTGVGYGKNAELLKKYYERENIDSDLISHAHNNYIQFLSGLGLFGFLFYIWFTTKIFFSTIKTWLYRSPFNSSINFLILGSLGIQACFHLGGFTQAVFEDAEVQHNYLFTTALTIAFIKAKAPENLKISLADIKQLFSIKSYL